ncbi:DUF7511 domain-containing protein [Natronorubrum sulfidifaciens]|uniref:DUF7511 domain-containing protein n=1 Tax=Natronorubrum sulfidifaciens JCM 14089 TaxID=1230460 RepID=L9W413_9EURY|nr:hypothetical protein [Natronorubrum sulfidifaciens]ELY44234.1 hypothetical protein C495_10044 [Natronorubrum sulfidifaciens JCM 14089]
MTERNTDGEHQADAAEPPAAGDTSPSDISPCYQAYLERNDHRPDVCTIYSTVTAGSIEETWIKATGSAFVSRDAMR